MPEVVATDGFDYPYTAADLTAEINRVPNLWGDLQEEGLFPGEYPTTTTVEIQFEDGRVTVLEADEPGRAGPGALMETQNGVILKIPHIPHFAYIRPKDLQDRWVFESGRKRLCGMEDANAKRLLALRRNHAQTLELLRWGALKGVLASGLGTVLYDFFEVFKIQKKVIDLALDNAATDVHAKCLEIRKHFEENLKGETMSGIRCKVSPELFFKLTSHPNVEKYYIQWQGAQALQGQIERLVFPFGGITWEVNYRVVSNIKGQAVKFIDAGKGVAYPVGTMETFRTHFGPAHHIAMVNTESPEVFVSPEILKHGQGVELMSQSNPLPLCQRPDLLVEVFSN